MIIYTSTEAIKAKIEKFSDSVKGFQVAEVLMDLVNRIELLEKKKEDKK